MRGWNPLLPTDSDSALASISDAVAARVRSLRAAAGLGRDEVAAAARAAGAPTSLSAVALGNIETGRRYPDGRRRREVTLDEAVWLAAALGVPVRQLLGEHAQLFGDPVTDDPRDRCGDVEAAARAAVEELGELDGQEPALAAAAYALARKLDGDAGMAAAAIAKELRAHLAELWRGRDDDEDDEDDLGAT